MKKFWKPFTAILTLTALAATAVTSVLALNDKTLKLDESLIAASASNAAVFSSRINVPYSEAEVKFGVFVSPDGDDSNGGESKGNAVRTLKRAQILVRNFFGNGGSGDAAIILADGEYYFDKPMELTADDAAGFAI